MAGRRTAKRVAMLGSSALLVVAVGGHASTADAVSPQWPSIRPLLEQHCYDCHGGKRTKGGVDLKRLAEDPSVASEYDLWDRVKQSVSSGEMPPDDQPRLAPSSQGQLLHWLNRSLEAAALANSGDPGIVTLRRLTNAEYDNTVRDLTGIDLGAAREFLPDGGGGEGFSNIGDVLFISPQQMAKYLAAARKLADHATVLPGSGLTFHHTRIGLRGPDQVKNQAEQALYVWYQKAAGPHLPGDDDDLREADYMLACWQFKHRAVTGVGPLDELARERGLSRAFLENWWNLLNADQTASRYLALTRDPWRALPGPDPGAPREVPAAVREALAEIQAQRKAWYDPKRGWASVQRMQQDSDGLQSYEMQANVKGKAAVHLVAGDVADGGRGDYVIVDRLQIDRGGKAEDYLAWLRGRLKADRQALQSLEGDALPAATEQPAALKSRVEEVERILARLGKQPPGGRAGADALVMKAPEILTLPLPGDATRFRAKGRLDVQTPESDHATVQWMATADAPPDPTTVFPGVLTVWKRQSSAHRQAMGEFSQMKNVFPDIYDRRLEEVARNYLRGGRGPGVYYFSDRQLESILPEKEKERMSQMLEDWRFLSPARLNQKQSGELDQRLGRHLEEFAARAWRRTLADDEKQHLAAVYTEARSRDLDPESAAREVIVRTLVSPNFLFKLEEAGKPGEQPVTPSELATRLSYFLWSSMPDEALRRAAADGSLGTPEGMAREVKRMLRDDRAGALASEFAGQWLQFHGFEKHGAVDQERFPEFTPELRRDFHRETVTFFSHIIREDRPVREILTADYTFLNERLAEHYGVPGVKGEELRKIPVAGHQRGGILGMGSLLTKTSYPHRTSPVLRGDWLLHAVLGAPTPPPPNDVPQLEEDSARPASLRERLEKHRADKACASCHDKIDPLGFALEGFDPIGRLRSMDELGRPIDTSAQLKDGTVFAGLQGLRDHLATRESEFIALLCRKLLGYALGRQVLPTDKPLLDQMQSAIRADEGRFSAAVLAIAQSRQFRNRKNE